jgi:hypothetical protein
VAISGLALRVGNQRRGDADRAAGVEHVDHRPVVGRVDPSAVCALLVVAPPISSGMVKPAAASRRRP